MCFMFICLWSGGALLYRLLSSSRVRHVQAGVNVVAG